MDAEQQQILVSQKRVTRMSSIDQNLQEEFCLWFSVIPSSVVSCSCNYSLMGI